MLILVITCLVLLVALHLAGRWVRARCDELDFGLFGPRDTSPRSSS
jgi:hypothetical protein